MAISASARRTTARSCCTTKWWIRRSTGCSKSAMTGPAPQPAGVRSAWRSKSIPSGRREQILRESGEGPSRGRPSCCDTFRDVLGGLRDFIEASATSSPFPPLLPIVEESPPFMRALTTASMDTPGPYEKVAKEAFFNVTLPEKNWTPGRRKSTWRASTAAPSSAPRFTKSIPATTSSFSGCKQAPIKVRKLIGCSSNAEGWAHYSEQMMLDEGYGKGDLKLRLGQLQDALLRDARYIVGIQMHTGKMTMAEGRRLLREGRLPGASGRRKGSQARHLRSHLSGLHAGQAGDHEAARGL